MTSVKSNLYLEFLRSTGVSTDTRSIAKGNLFFALSGPSFNGNRYAQQALDKGATSVVVDDKEVVQDNRYILVDDCLKSLQNLANEHRNSWGKTVIGLTGSNGKTTTKELMNSVLKEKFSVLATEGNLNNHIGVPLTLLNINKTHEIAIIEMGANNPLEIKTLCEIANPNYGLITNIGMAHLEGFGSIEGVAKAKTEMYDYLSENGGDIFLNIDDHWLIEKALNRKIALTYGKKEKKPDVMGEMRNNSDRLIFELSKFNDSQVYKVKTNLAGSYNLSNALAAVAVGLKFGMIIESIIKGLEAYVPDNNRSQLAVVKGVSFILDAYNANPSSVEEAIKNLIGQEFVGEKAIVLGDMLELGAFSNDAHSDVLRQMDGAGFNPTILVGKEFWKLRDKAPKSFVFFENRDDLKAQLSKYPLSGKLTLVKGSRGIGLDKLPEWI
ncbi:MAG: UDP-N-acetylmuramoyl-tripeptide--D-alanyl-D-alanine ligase [Sphingobacteriales bacterium]|jgi:UDP-N-acetylmuramoyl-tripeptide--D-alanyl-D-alanine ligase